MPDDRVLRSSPAPQSGIGAATARAAAAEAGYSLVLAARSQRQARRARRRDRRDRALAVATDVTDWEDNERWSQAALDRFGRIDVVFANAGFGAARGWLKETPEHWREMVLTNVLGAAYTLRAAIPAVKETKGHLLVTGSVAGRRALPGSLYSCTKWAVTAMGEAVAPGPQRHRRPRHARSSPAWSTRRSSTTAPDRRAAARRHRPCCDVRRVPARRTSTSTRSSSGPRPQPT